MPSLPISEAAQLLGVRPASIWRRIRAGELPLHRETGPDGERWIVEINDDDIAAAARGPDPLNANELRQLVGDLQAEVALLAEELDAYRHEATDLAAERTSVHEGMARTLSHLRDLTGQQREAAPSSAPPPSAPTVETPQAVATPPSTASPSTAPPSAETPAAPPPTAEPPDVPLFDQTGREPPRSAEGITFPSDILHFPTPDTAPTPDTLAAAATAPPPAAPAVPGDVPAPAATPAGSPADSATDAPATEEDSTNTPPESPADTGAAGAEVEPPASADTATDTATDADAAVADVESAAIEEDTQAAPIATAASAARSRFVDAGGIRLHCLEWGEPSRPTVLLLHGLTGNAHNFDALAQQLEGWFHCIAPDLRGHGDSAWSPDHQYQLSLFVQDLNRFLDAMQLQGVHLVGTALGGDIALAYAGARPAAVSTLVVNDTGPELIRSGENRVRQYIQDSPQNFASMDAALDWWQENYPMLREYDEAIVRSFVGYSVREQADGTVTWKFDPVFRNLAESARLRDVDLWASARSVRCPTLIVRGAESDILSPVVAQRLHDTIPGSQVVEAADTAHAPSLVEPQVLPLLRRFLQQDRTA